ncbi:hypothetical protein F506_14290 [Herbaspirillum hiltneri N3]|uniref:Secreted protein n=1 Tax=Herbaspirillum hiltneri N3 TaxID=1262470 RepID=A0ABN4HYF2_9BURK|nr:hypothetical protein [Herbaspirillum hiltneri]AKZ63679.1 hypothetical protein F506_14290 [Herbaspirillum hiltneri N3]
MQFIFLLWPILLLPVFVSWLTRERPVTPLPPRPSTSRRIVKAPAIAPSPAERRSNSLAYRRAAVQAYETMLALESDDHDENDPEPSSQCGCKEQTPALHARKAV